MATGSFAATSSFSSGRHNTSRRDEGYLPLVSEHEDAGLDGIAACAPSFGNERGMRMLISKSVTESLDHESAGSKSPSLKKQVRATILEMDREEQDLRQRRPQPSRMSSMLGEDDPYFTTLLPGSFGGTWLVECWDMYMLVCVFFISFFVPYALCLYAPNQEPAWHAVINIVLTLSATLDIVMHFVTAKPLPQDGVNKELWVKDIREVARHYAQVPTHRGASLGWFWIDLAMIAPGWYLLLIERMYRMSNPVLLLYIFRMFWSTSRLMRLGRMRELAHAFFGFPLFMLEVIKFVFLTTLTCHWIACAWVLVEGKITQGFFSIRGVDASWLSALIDAKGDACEPDASQDPGCVYLLAYYWAVMTLTTVGYGDISPQNKVEYLLSVVCMVLVSYIWAYIVGSIVAILSDLDPSTREFRHNMDGLVGYMKRRGLPNELQVRMRTYMYDTRDLIDKRVQKSMVEEFFSEGLQRELVTSSLEAKLLKQHVYWVRDLEDTIIMDIVRSMQARSYGGNETILLRGHLCCLQQGLVGLRGRLMTRGDVWGFNDILVETQQLIDTSVPQTLKYSELLCLSRPVLMDIAHKYPEADKRLRRAQIRTAVARAFVFLAQKVKLSRGKLRRDPTLEDLSHHLRSVAQGESSFSSPGARSSLHMLQGDQRDNTFSQKTNHDLWSQMMDMSNKQDEMRAQMLEILSHLSNAKHESPSSKLRSLRSMGPGMLARVAGRGSLQPGHGPGLHSPGLPVGATSSSQSAEHLGGSEGSPRPDLP